MHYSVSGSRQKLRSWATRSCGKHTIHTGFSSFLKSMAGCSKNMRWQQVAYRLSSKRQDASPNWFALCSRGRRISLLACCRPVRVAAVMVVRTVGEVRTFERKRITQKLRGVGRNWRRGCSYFSSLLLLSFLPSPPLPSPFPGIPALPFHSSVPCPSLPSSLPSFPVPFPLLPLEVGSLKPARGLGERCKLHKRGPGRSPGRNRIWYTLELLESHW